MYFCYLIRNPWHDKVTSFLIGCKHRAKVYTGLIIFLFERVMPTCMKKTWSSWEEIIKVVNKYFYYMYFGLILSWNRTQTFICTNVSHLLLRNFASSSVEIGPVVLEKKPKAWKIYKTSTNIVHNLIRKAHLSLRFRYVRQLNIKILQFYCYM